MSDYHILEQNKKKDSVTVAFHISIPDTNNAAGVNHRTALKEARNPVTVVPFLPTVEATQISDGEIFEILHTIKFSNQISNAAKQTIIENKFTSKSSDVLNTIQDQLEFWGLSGTVT